MQENSHSNRVCFYLHTIYNGGVERAYFNLAQQLLARGWQVDLVVNVLRNSPFIKKIPQGVRVINLNARRIWGRPWALVQYLRREKPLVLISSLHFSNEIAVLAKKIARVNTRVIVSEHTTISVELSKLPVWHPRRRLIPLVARWAYRRAHARVAVSQGCARDLAGFLRIPLDEITVIYNPALTDDIASLARAPIKHPWFQPGQLPVILGVGRLEQQKNFSNLLQAFALVREKNEARLLILGEGSLRKDLEKEVARLGIEDDVQLMGFVENPFAFLANASVFVLSSDWEGLAIVVIESLAVGTRVVATDCPSGPREILDGGRFGQLVPVADPATLAIAIQKALSEPSPKIPVEWIEQFTAPYVTGQYESLF